MPLGKNYFKTDPLNLKGKTPIGMAGFDNVRDTIDHQQNKILKEVIDDAITALGLPLSHINAAEITDVGTNTHAQIDTHIADASDPHGTTLTQTNLTVSGAFTSQGIDDNANAVAITIDSSERVGIGTASPSGNLHINSSLGEGNPTYEGGNLIISQLNSAGNWVRNTLISSASGSSVVEFGDAGNSRAGFIRYDNTLNKFFIATNSARVTDSDVVIDTNGNVGIGTTTPTHTLNVVGTTNITGGLTTNLKSASCDVKSNTNGTLYCGTDATGSAGGDKMIISGRGTASISVDEFYHPSGGVLVANDDDESQLMRLPYAGTLHNLTFVASANQGSGDVCVLFVRYTSTFATSTSRTALFANITDVNQVASDTSTSLSVAEGSYIKIEMDEEGGGSCVLIPSWSF